MAISPPNYEKKLYFILVNCMGLTGMHLYIFFINNSKMFTCSIQRVFSPCLIYKKIKVHAEIEGESAVIFKEGGPEVLQAFCH